MPGCPSQRRERAEAMPSSCQPEGMTGHRTCCGGPPGWVSARRCPHSSRTPQRGCTKSRRGNAATYRRRRKYSSTRPTPSGHPKRRTASAVALTPTSRRTPLFPSCDTRAASAHWSGFAVRVDQATSVAQPLAPHARTRGPFVVRWLSRWDSTCCSAIPTYATTFYADGR